MSSPQMTRMFGLPPFAIFIAPTDRARAGVHGRRYGGPYGRAASRGIGLSSNKSSLQAAFENPDLRNARSLVSPGMTKGASMQPLEWRLLPLALVRLRLRPVHAQPHQERTARRGQPIALLVTAGRLVLDVEREAAILV